LANNLTSIELSRTYRFDDPVEEKKAEWGLLLWRLLRNELPEELSTPLRDTAGSAYILERLTNYMLARLVTRGVMVAKEMKDLPQEIQDEAYRAAVDDLLNVEPEVRENIVWHLSRICSRIRTDGGELTGAQIDKIEQFATTNSHRCYVCGRALGFPTVPYSGDVAETAQLRKFGIDHIFPQSRGGGRNPGNLAACCKQCNEVKDAFLSYVDFHLERDVLNTSDPDMIRRRFGNKVMRVALLWRQLGKCAMCETHFFDAPDERQLLHKKNKLDPYHFFNIEVLCGRCVDTYSIQGVFLE
jgi:HNH endonuclease